MIIHLEDNPVYKYGGDINNKAVPNRFFSLVILKQEYLGSQPNTKTSSRVQPICWYTPRKNCLKYQEKVVHFVKNVFFLQKCSNT